MSSICAMIVESCKDFKPNSKPARFLEDIIEEVHEEMKLKYTASNESVNQSIDDQPNEVEVVTENTKEKTEKPETVVEENTMPVIVSENVTPKENESLTTETSDKEKTEPDNITEEPKEETTMINPIVVEEPSGKVRINLSNATKLNGSMKPKEEKKDLFKGEAFDKLPMLEKIKVVLEANGVNCDIVEDQCGLFKANMFIADSYLGSFYIDRDGCLFNTIPKIVLSLTPDPSKLEELPMLALFNTNWPSILTEFSNGNILSACDCITSQERELNELIDLASIPSKIKDSQRAKLLKNLEMMKMEGVFNDILIKEKNSRFRVANYKDSGTFDLISDDNVKKSLLAPYATKQPHQISVDFTKGGDERFVKTAL